MGAAARQGEKMSKQPRDDANDPIPVLGYRAGAAQTITTSGSSQRSTAFSKATSVISIFCTADCHIEVGDSTVTATTSSHFIPASNYIDLAVKQDLNDESQKHIAVIQASSSGTFHISERS
tara:strand:+ start:3135 stop:3497 length:363 start_codon:yes stop_codon:yes gene_type:complete